MLVLGIYSTFVVQKIAANATRGTKNTKDLLPADAVLPTSLEKLYRYSYMKTAFAAPYSTYL